MAVAGLRSTVRLNNLNRMPMFGLGCRRTESDLQTERAVSAALERGYRFIDTASVYENEAAVGRAIRASSIPRHDIFVSTKVWNSDQGYDRTLAAFDRSLRTLGLEYLDLYLLHWPMIRLRTESWRALVRIVEGGRCRSIGVSNFTIRHITELVNATGVVPAVNVVEFNPYLNQAGLLRWCASHEIQLITNRPVPRGNRLRDRRLLDIAGHYGREPDQILIRWGVQKGVAVLTRTMEPAEISRHADVFDFEISLKDMDVLGSFHENRREHWDPTKAP
jgi:diketogulonate reductase-like aldo/keto reductase